LERAAGLRLTSVACDPTSRVLQRGDLGTQGPGIAIAAGVHGDEPAAPWGLLSTIEDGLLDERFAYRVWPCTNPSGYVAGTRWNADGVDVNRSFSGGGSTPESRAIVAAQRSARFALSLDLHEDYEADGFYCYVAGPGAEGLGRAVVGAVEEAGFPVQDFEDFDFGEPAAANPHRRCERGIVVMDAHESRYFDGLSYNLFMVGDQIAEHVATLETPSKRRWEERIAMDRVAIVAAIGYVARAWNATR
jgi:hypothetical protein